ncbi:MAG: Fur family transcriptional regulator [Thermomicrobiales bacterium]
MLPVPDHTHHHDHPVPAPLTRRSVEDILSQHGYRLTGPRATIVETMLQYDRPFTAEQLVAALRPADAASETRQIGRATVYRTLEILASVDVLTRLIQADGHPAYVWDTPGHRHHLVCTGCGTAVSFTSCPVNEIVSTLTRETDFVIQDHMLEVFGLCPKCQASGQPATL